MDQINSITLVSSDKFKKLKEYHKNIIANLFNHSINDFIKLNYNFQEQETIAHTITLNNNEKIELIFNFENNKIIYILKILDKNNIEIYSTYGYINNNECKIIIK